MVPRKILLAIPLIILAVSVVYAETYRHASNPAPLSRPLLQLLGYNYNRQLVQLSVTLWNKGDEPLTITEVFYDEVKLTKGQVGHAADHTMMTKDDGHSMDGVIPTNKVIFAAADHWNLANTGPNSRTIAANGVVSLYLGVTSTDPGSKHLLTVIAEEKKYVFTLKFDGD